MGNPEKKYVDDFKIRIQDNPGTVTPNMLIRAIRAEIQGKLIPQFVKNEICRTMSVIKEFVNENGWARKPIRAALVKLFLSIAEVKPNHEGYVRVQFADFRKAFDDVKGKHSPPQLIEMPDLSEKIINIRGNGSPVSVINYRECLDCGECIEARRATMDSPSIQHYRTFGMRIWGNISEDIDVPRVVADANEAKRLIGKVRKFLSRHPRLQSLSLDIALLAAEELLKQDALWIILCTRVRQSLQSILRTEYNIAGKTIVEEEVRTIFNSTLPYLERFEDWARFDKLNSNLLKVRAHRNHMTHDEMLMQAKRLQNKSPDDCL